MKKCTTAFFLGLLIFSFAGNAQEKSKTAAAPPPPQKGETLNEENAVFAEASFDSKVIAVLPPGKTYSISNGIFGGAFYRIRVKDGMVGYIADSDVRTFGSKIKSKDKKKEAKKEADEEDRKQNNKGPFEFSRYLGASFSSIKYEEETMGSGRSEAVPFYGVKLSGSNVLIEGLIPTEINVEFALKPPSYYEQLTKQSANGFIFITDFMLQNYLPQGRNSMIFFGFGPMFRYSKFDVAIKDSTTGSVSSYSLEDMAIGAAFNLGGAVRLGSVALRLELKYHWEKRSYFGFGGALQLPF